MVSDVAQNHHKDERKNLKIMIPLTTIAAIVLMVFLVSKFWSNDKKSVSGNELFAEYYEPYKPDFNTRGEINLQDDIMEALETYTSKNYPAAIPKFQKILQNDSTLVFAKFFLAVSYIETDQLNEAISLLTNISTFNDNIYQMHAQWYLALCYLKKEDMEKAATVLKNIELNNEFYSQKAKEILIRIT